MNLCEAKPPLANCRFARGTRIMRDSLFEGRCENGGHLCPFAGAF